MIQPSLFDGATFDYARDGQRLTGQLLRVYNAMLSGNWMSLDHISSACGDPPASVSARIRDLRKPKFGEFVIEREYRGKGLFAYKLNLKEGP